MNRLDGIGGRHLRDALLFVRTSRAPVSADDAAEALGVHRSVARNRLERLLDAGLLRVTFARRPDRSGPGAGRPAKLYSPAPEQEALEFPPRRLPALLARLIDELPVDGRAEVLRRVGEDYGRGLARVGRLRPRTNLDDGLERVCATVRSLGFQAALERIDGDTAVISTPTCPLRPLVTERPEAAHIDHGMWAGLVECGLRNVQAEAVECETRSCLDHGESCSVLIRIKR